MPAIRWRDVLICKYDRKAALSFEMIERVSARATSNCGTHLTHGTHFLDLVEDAAAVKASPMIALPT